MTAPSQSYLSGSNVDLTVALPQVAGAAVVPTSISYTVTDENGTVIDGPVAVDPATITGGATSFGITIEGFNNTYTPPANVTNAQMGPLLMNITARTVTTTMQTAKGQFVDTQTYIVRGDQPLTRMVNTFVLSSETAFLRYQMTNMDGWDAASEDDRLAALQTAFINMLTLRYRFPIGENSQSRILDFYGMSVDNVFGRIYEVLADIALYTAEDFNGWPGQFTTALRRAQLREANHILGGDPVADKRDAGIGSEVVGDSKTYFRPIRTPLQPLCEAAMVELRGFLDRSVLIGRA